MGLKILHTADWHLDSPFSGMPEKERQMLRQAQRELPDRIAELCRREKCDLVLLAGDVFDGQPGRECIESVKMGLERCRVPVLIAPGNHDFYSMASVWHTERWPENVHIFRNGMESVALEELDCRVYGAAYRSMDCPPLLAGFRAEGKERWHIGLLHGDPVTADSPYCAISRSQVRESGLDYLALGHIHRGGSFRAGSTLCVWPGCPMGRGWDETGEKYVCVATLEDTVEFRQVSLDVPRFYELTVEENGPWEEALEAVLPAAESSSFFRVSLRGSTPPEISGLRKRFSYLSGLELRDETKQSGGLWDWADEDSLRGAYFRLLRERLENELERSEEILLAAEISRRLLEGREVTLP